MLDGGPVALGKVIKDVAFLMANATLHRHVTEHLVDCGPQRLAAIKADGGTTMLIVEQNANLALAIADRAYVLESGDLVLEGTGKELLSDPRVRTAYLGV